jgi:hypothetical protein
MGREKKGDEGEEKKSNTTLIAATLAAAVGGGIGSATLHHTIEASEGVFAAGEKALGDISFPERGPFFTVPKSGLSSAMHILGEGFRKDVAELPENLEKLKKLVTPRVRDHTSRIVEEKQIASGKHER